MNCDPIITALLAIIPESAISPLSALSEGVYRHPLCELIGDMAHPSPLARATIDAMRGINQTRPDWMKALRTRLISEDFANAAAALGEIRAYGTLAMAGFIPNPLTQQANPDFKIELDQQTIIVEVHTRQMDHAARAKLDEWANEVSAVPAPKGVTVWGSPPIAPFGEPDPAKPGDTVLSNMISRIAAIKAREHQLQDNGANVLWLDLCSGPTSMLVDTTSALPFASHAGRIFSGVLWGAVYGTCGLPIVEARSHGHHVIVPMGHNGKFRGTPTKVSGVIAACRDGVVLLEHPDPTVPLPQHFRNALLMLMDFRAERSVCAWGNERGIVSRTVDIQEMSLRAIVQTLKQRPFLYQDSHSSPTHMPGLEG